MKFLRDQWPSLFIVLLCILSRLPQLLSNELLLDGDECVIGLMAKHFNEGKEIAIYFHGQSYGFSFIETALVSLAYLVNGMNDLSVKLPMLLLWTGGVLFFYKALREINTGNKWLPLLITFVLIFSPSWALWSMKARGGYITAFFFSSLMIWILFLRNYKRPYGTYFFIGFCIVVIYQSQPLWLPGLLPVLAYKIYHQRTAKNFLGLAAGMLPTMLLFFWLKKFASQHWAPKVFDISSHTLLLNIKDLPSHLFHSLNGYYYLYYIYTAPLSCRVFAYVSIALIAMLLVMTVWYLLKSFKKHTLFILSVLSVLFTIGYTLFLVEETPRYLLPLTGFLLFALFVFLDRIKRSITGMLICGLLMVIGIPAVISFKTYTYFPARREEVLACVDYMERNDVKYCFSNDGLLQWQIMFYSKEKIICRESSNDDRYPEYVHEVTNAYYKDREHLAVIDNTTDLQSIAHEKAVNVISHFYIVIHPEDEVIRDMEFKL